MIGDIVKADRYAFRGCCGLPGSGVLVASQRYRLVAGLLADNGLILLLAGLYSTPVSSREYFRLR